MRVNQRTSAQLKVHYRSREKKQNKINKNIDHAPGSCVSTLDDLLLMLDQSSPCFQWHDYLILSFNVRPAQYQ